MSLSLHGGGGVSVLLSNTAAVACYVAFVGDMGQALPAIDPASGFQVPAGATVGPLGVPNGPTLLLVACSGTGTLRVTVGRDLS